MEAVKCQPQEGEKTFLFRSNKSVVSLASLRFKIDKLKSLIVVLFARSYIAEVVGIIDYIYTLTFASKRVKQSRYRPGVAQRFPGI